jgi:hypothetical protein
MTENTPFAPYQSFLTKMRDIAIMEKPRVFEYGSFSSYLAVFKLKKKYFD